MVLSSAHLGFHGITKAISTAASGPRPTPRVDSGFPEPKTRRAEYPEAVRNERAAVLAPLALNRHGAFTPLALNRHGFGSTSSSGSATVARGRRGGSPGGL